MTRPRVALALALALAAALAPLLYGLYQGAAYRAWWDRPPATQPSPNDGQEWLFRGYGRSR